jgi:hypothetical protein
MIEAMKQARDFISRLKFPDAEPEPEVVMAVLDKAIAEAEKQEPVAHLLRRQDRSGYETGEKTDYGAIPVYTASQQHTWIGLTDEDCERMSAGDKVVAMWAERTLKKKNTHPQPKREWVGLTNEEIDEAWRSAVTQAIEAKLKEKNS